MFFLTLGTIAGFVGCNNQPKEKSKEEINKQNETLLNVNKYLVSKDAALIRAYSERRGWKMTTSQSGLWYMITTEGKGDAPQTGKMAEINYSLSLLDGTPCYSSDSLGTKKFRIGKGGIESGLEEGILLMHEGGKAVFILPPHLAHGLMGDDNKIPPRAILLYEVELLKISD
jgi:FKBP-type peptidyl-prolyl cis-trans isomerase